MKDVFGQRLRILQLFRHEAAHLVTALQAYVHGQLLGDCWDQLQSNIKVRLLPSCEQQVTWAQMQLHSFLKYIRVQTLCSL